MFFRDVIGQQNIKKKLIQTVKEGRISHAQLFLGMEGSGNLALALAYAKYVSCENKGENDSCGKCPSCLKYEKLIHPDLHFVYPVSTTKPVTINPISDDFIKDWREIVLENPYINLNKWYEKIGIENKQGIISRNESYQILKKLNLKSFESDYKVMIIWMPEKMNSSASNKLLKIIEEPPSKTIFLMVSENSGQIISTILSRTQIIKIPKIDDQSILSKIEELNINKDINKNKIVHLANGNYLKVLELIQKTGEQAINLEKFKQIMRLCYKKDIIEIMNWVDEITKAGRENQKEFLHFSIKMIRENYFLNLGINDIVYLNDDEAEFSKNFHPFINSNNIMNITEELTNACNHIEYNAYSKIVFFDLALKLVKLI